MDTEKTVYWVEEFEIAGQARYEVMARTGKLVYNTGLIFVNRPAAERYAEQCRNR